MRAQAVVMHVVIIVVILPGANAWGAVPGEQTRPSSSSLPLPPTPNARPGSLPTASGGSAILELATMGTDSYCKDSLLSDGHILLNDEGTRSSRPQFRPDIGMAEDGSFVVVWNDWRYLTLMLLAQRFDSSGTRLGCELPVAVYPEYSSGDRQYGDLQTKVAVYGDGSFVVTWEQEFRVYAHLFGADGTAKGDPISVLDPEGVGYAYNPAITVLSSGTFVIVWEDERNSYNDDIYGQMFDVTGHPIGVNFKISDDTTGREQWNSAIASDSDGRFYVVWQDGLLYGNPQGYGASDIYYQIFDSDGHAVNHNRRISDSTQSRLFDRPCIVSDASGNCTVLWRSLDETLRICRLSNTGVSTYGIKDPIDSNTAFGNGDSDPIALSLGKEGGVTVAWIRRRAPRSLYDIYARYIDSSGNAKGSSFPVMASDTSGFQFESSPAVITDEYGRSIFVWSHDTVTQGADIRLVRLDFLNQRLSGPEQVNRDGSWQYQPSVAADDNGKVSVVWCDERYRPKGNGVAVVLQRLDGTSSLVDANIQLSLGNESAYNSTVSIDSAGNTVVFWNDLDERIKTCRVDRLAGVPSPITTVVVDTAYSIDKLDVSTGEKGCMLVWAATYIEGGDVTSKIKAQRVTYDRQAIGPLIVISDTNWYCNPAVAMRHGGPFAIAWELNERQIFVQLFDSSSLPIIQPIAVGDSSTYGIVSRSRPDIGVDSDGNFRVVWFESSITETAIMSSTISADGSLSSSPNKVMASAEQLHAYSSLQLVSTRDARVAVVWDRVFSTGGNQIMCQFVGPSGNPDGDPIEVSHPASSDYLPMFPSACYSNGRLFVAWQNNRVGWDSDIWGRFIDLSPTAVEDEPTGLPFSLEVGQNYPNPFNAGTTINYQVPVPTELEITVLNVLGQQTRKLFSGRVYAGQHTVTWDGKDDRGQTVASGVYLYRIQTEHFTNAKKMVLLK